MGRPPLRRDAKVKKRTIWVHDDQVDRITALYGAQGLSRFIRKAVDAQLKVYEAQAAAAAPRTKTAAELIAEIFDDE